MNEGMEAIEAVDLVDVDVDVDIDVDISVDVTVDIRWKAGDLL